MDNDLGQSGNIDLDSHLVERLRIKQGAKKKIEVAPRPKFLQRGREDEMLYNECKLLKEHIDLSKALGTLTDTLSWKKAEFFVKTAASRTKCQLLTCGSSVEPEDYYRVTLKPAMSSGNWRRGLLDSLGMIPGQLLSARGILV